MFLLRRITWLACAFVLTMLATASPAFATWSVKAPLSPARAAHAAAVADDGGGEKIFVFGGNSSTGGSIAVPQKYDPATNTWTAVAAMPTPRSRLVAVTVNNMIYVIGGQIGATAQSTVEAYDPVNDSWTMSLTAMPTPRSFAAAAAGSNGLIYVFGGTNVTSVNTVEAYDPVTDSWATGLTAMPTARAGIAAATACNGLIYVVGGHTGNGRQNEAYDPLLDSWTVAPQMNTGDAEIGAATGGDGMIYVVGGSGHSGTAHFESFDPVTGVWTTLPAPPGAGRDELAAVALCDTIYALGGSKRETSGGNTWGTFNEEWSGIVPVPSCATVVPGCPCANDATPPVLSCPLPVSFIADRACGAKVPKATATDDCDPNPTVTQSATGINGVGFHSVTYTASDAAGNTSSCTVQYQIVDQTPPALSCPLPVSILADRECSADPLEAKVTDNCDPNPALVTTPPVLNGTGMTTVNYTATDASGNVSTCSTLHQVVDFVDPTLECGAAASVTDTVGDDDNFNPGDPGDNPGPGPSFAGCPYGGGPVGTDTPGANLCRAWNHTYAMDPDACVSGARLTLDWELVDTLCGACAGGPDRPTETITFSSASGTLTFGRCFDPFTQAMYGNCPNPNTAGITTLDLADFPGVLGLIDGTPLSISITDDTRIDFAELEIDFTTPNGGGMTVVADPDTCCAEVRLGTCTGDNCSDVSVTNNIDPPQEGDLSWCYPVGTTLVEFTGTDASGNATTCTQEIKVIEDEPCDKEPGCFDAVSGGGGFSLALRDDPLLFSWGGNTHGQLGQGTFTGPLPNPDPVLDSTGAANLVDVVSFSAGGYEVAHALSIDNNGFVWSWGRNGNGQLGEGSFSNSSLPVAVRDVSGNPLGDIQAVSGGGIHSLALDNRGQVWSWGANNFGQLGNGTIGGPVNLADLVLDPASGGPLRDIVAIAAGVHHSLAIDAGGNVWSWGRNTDGQLGNGGTVNQPLPVQVVDFTGVALVDVVDIDGGFGHSVALDSGGRAWAWGRNLIGELGDGAPGGIRPHADLVSAAAMGPVRDVAAGDRHSLALDANGAVWSWGNDTSGQLGDGLFGGFQSLPVMVVNTLTGAIQAIDGGFEHSIALGVDRWVYTWGRNAQGQLGDGSQNDSDVPVAAAVTCDDCENDKTPPVISCPLPVSILGGDKCSASPPPASAVDECDAKPKVTASPDPLTGPGLHTVTYTAIDASGNVSTCTVVHELICR